MSSFKLNHASEKGSWWIPCSAKVDENVGYESHYATGNAVKMNDGFYNSLSSKSCEFYHLQSLRIYGRYLMF